MKRHLFRIIILVTFIGLVCGAPTVRAATDPSFFKIIFDEINMTCTITGFNNGLPANVDIPDTINGYRVTSIGDNAFYSYYSLSSITIPSSVTSIGNNAFYSCYSLSSITIPSSVTSIGNGVFFQCYFLEAAYFKGNAPNMGTDIFTNCAAGVYYRSSNGGGYTGWSYPKVALDDTAPVLNNVTPTALKTGDQISATSTKTGVLYLVSKGSYADKTALDGASPKKIVAVTTAGAAVSIDTGGLPEGSYQVYAIDNADSSLDIHRQAMGLGPAPNLSNASDDIIIDNTAPTVTVLTPGNNSGNIKLNTALTLTFSETVTAGAGNIILHKADGEVAETIAASSATISDKTVTITPGNILSLDTGYYVTVDQTAFQDPAGNAYSGIADETVWAFTTVQSSIGITFSRPTEGARLNINTGSTVIVKLTDNGLGIDTGKVTVQVDNSPAVKPTSLVKTSDGYTLYYVITNINYGTPDNSHTITVTAYDLTGGTGSASVNFAMEPKRKGFGFGRLRFE
jgi:hypothetical protein